jgi:pimeloyl-ACP methyl ester carboxylesterase
MTITASATSTRTRELDLAGMPACEGVAHREAVVNGFRLHYAEAGAGEPLVLLHGWPQHWWEWRHVIGPLAERYRLICPDIRGLGWSEGPGAGAVTGDYSLRALVGDLVGLLDALGLERVRLVGHDWGSAVGYRAALTLPHRFERAVMMGGVHPWSVLASPRLYLRPWHLWAYAALGAPVTTRFGVPAHTLRTWRHRGEFSDTEIETYVDRMRQPAALGATRAYDRNILLRVIPYFVRHHRAMRLRVRTLHLNGAEDPLTRAVPRDSWRPYADDMRYELLSDCGHFLAEERPDELLDRLTSFLR